MSPGLSPEDRQRLEELFERAAELPRAERSAFVERECGSHAALKGELEGLLEGLAGEDILERIQPGAPSRAGTCIGPYRLLERIGEGGMGEVYAAEQLEPIARRVALKIIKPGMDSAQVVARFEAERQALALMTHPNVAQVYDGGATEDGRPYFVMELVDGAQVTEYCDRNRLSTRARLELFLGICDGVQHAHQKGIIHRDLKPSNLLVAEQDGRAVPKVIDFGVARATSGHLAERLQTMVGQIVGTLEYMSPEQADPARADIDTRSDIYSLGVVLYQLVSGLLPFEHDSASDVPLSELQRAIRDQDPPTPSTRLRRATGTVTAIAPLHGTDERSLVRQLAGDLDWICMKALEKDAARRYPSASELAEDLRRHLAHQPVLAGRPGVLYRARKFVRRNRLGMTAGALTTIGAVAGVLGIVSGRLEAEARAKEALAARDRADEAMRLARAERDKVLRLSDIKLQEQIKEQADELWPTHPERIPEMKAWLARAGELVSRSGLHSAALELMRAGAAVRSEDGDWLFEQTADQWQHDVLVELIEGLHSLSDLLAEDAILPESGWSCPKRLSAAERLRAAFGPGGAYDGAWDEALPRIRAAYPGLDLSPQAGLLPLGPDPHSGLWEFAHLLSGAPAPRIDGELVMTEEAGIVLVLLPGGECSLGAQDTDPTGPNFDPEAMENGARSMHVAHIAPFFLSKFEMTQGQWARFTGDEPRMEAEERTLDRPVTHVSWWKCQTVVRRLGLALPDEEQWEYAARAGTTTRWWTGDDPGSLRGAGNFMSRGTRERLPSWAGDTEPIEWDDGAVGLAPVGRYPANPFGLHDVLGNVSEWCGQLPEEVGSPNGSFAGGQRISRGGSWRHDLDAARSAFRRWGPPAYTNPAQGLRPAREIDQ